MTTLLSDAGSREALTILTFGPRQLKFSLATLRELLVDMPTAMFFAMLYRLTPAELSDLVVRLFDVPLVQELNKGGHSESLQDYLLDPNFQAVGVTLQPEDLTAPAISKSQLDGLAGMWEMRQVGVAQAISEVANALGTAVGRMPGVEGQMHLKHMMQLNRQRQTLGVSKYQIAHKTGGKNLVVLDDSGSMTKGTITAILKDVVGLSYMADAALVLVSSSARYWAPGSFSAANVESAIELGGTHYEKLQPLLNQSWGTVVTIADYDSSISAKDVLAQCTGTIEEIVDISLVNRPTFLAECLGTRAKKITPMLLGTAPYLY